MSAELDALLAQVARTETLRARVLPLFEPPHGVPLGVLRVIEALLEADAAASSWRRLADAMRQAETCLRILEQWRPMVAFGRLAEELGHEAERRA